MKTLTQLSAVPTEGNLEGRGAISTLHLEDPNCKGWFVGISLGAGGILFRAKRPDGAGVAIPLDALVALAREHAPEVFADAKAIEQAKALAEARANHPAGKRLAP